jgi:pyruvate/2-oxoglutarate dehydrogenase complex dihydrolipoamide acyltransferase (E2) component
MLCEADTLTTIKEWMVKPGDRIEIGTPLAVVETDKVAVDLESDTEERVSRFLVGPGHEVVTGQEILEVD